MTWVPPELSRRRSLRILGLMSGTSGDGIDGAVVELRERPRALPEVVAIRGRTIPFPDSVRDSLIADLGSGLDVAGAAIWDARLGALFAEAAAGLGAPQSIDLVSISGHTFAHLPAASPRATLQLGNPALAAERLGVPVVAGFRAADVARGGEGAPLVPAADRILFSQPGRNVVVLNFGGIANATWLPADGSDPRARDLGPANLVLNHLVHRGSDRALRFDRNGELARTGTPHRALLERWNRHPFFRKDAPRSTGREEFGERWVDAELESSSGLRSLPLEDQLATAVAWITESVARGIDRLGEGASADRILIGGGGARNRALITALDHQLRLQSEVLSADDHGVSADLREAAAFAILAHETLRGRPGSFPGTTGCRYAGPLGAFYPSCAAEEPPRG